MEILEALQDRVPEGRALQRLVILGPDTGAAHLSAVLVRVPPHHEFPLHTHPRSEDCFFVLAGAGEAFDPGRRLPIAAPAGVWIPAGRAHGLAAGPSGMLEIGFQSPPDPTAVPFDAGATAAGQIVARTLAGEARAAAAPAGWLAVFPERPPWRHLDPHFAVLAASQRLAAEARGHEVAVVVARGAVVVHQRRLAAVAALHLAPGEHVELCACEPSTLVVGVRAHAAA